jgi:hypothetical protein
VRIGLGKKVEKQPQKQPAPAAAPAGIHLGRKRPPRQAMRSGLSTARIDKGPPSTVD